MAFAFRSSFVYLSLYCLTNQVLPSLLPIPSIDVPKLAQLPPLKPAVTWTAAHLFGHNAPLVYQSGSGDKTFDWVLAFCILALSLVACALWSVVDRRPAHPALYRWFRLFLRFALAGQMITYGLVKVIPLQMPFPSLTRLVEPFGNLSPMGVLWASIGASPPFEIYAGAVETVAGLLLLAPHTTLAGAMLSLLASVHIFALNMTYDVPVKLFSFHLIVISLFLLAPDLGRLVRVILLNRAVGPGGNYDLFVTRRANRIAFAVQIAFGALLVAGHFHSARKSWFEYGGGRTKPLLYGIWTVETTLPEQSETHAWRRIIFDRPDTLAVQNSDESLHYFGLGVDTSRKRLFLKRRGVSGNEKMELAYDRQPDGQMKVSGQWSGQAVSLSLRRVDEEKCLLLSRGFHWVQEHPFNR